MLLCSQHVLVIHKEVMLVAQHRFTFGCFDVIPHDEEFLELKVAKNVV
jgi:hypothetical protein